MGIEEIIRENERRRDRNGVARNPQTGEGCSGKRIMVELADAPCSRLWLPEEMMETDVCRDIATYGSIKKILKEKMRYRKVTAMDIAIWWINFCQFRYLFDFEFFAFTEIKIMHRYLAITVPFVLNRSQGIILECLERFRLSGRPVRLNYLKSRQIGGSTLIQLYMYWIQRCIKENWDSVICAHLKSAAKKIRSMYTLAVRETGSIYGEKCELVNFENEESIKKLTGRGNLIAVGSAETPDSIRSQAPKMVHFSEVSSYPQTENSSPENIEASIISAVPNIPYTMIVRETTAKGEDYFYDKYMRSKNGEDAFEYIFVPWYYYEYYSKDFNGKYYTGHNGKDIAGTIADFVMSMNDYEKNCFQNYPDLTLENLNWRREMAATQPSETVMRQEFPINDIEAFRNSGSPVFNADHIDGMRSDCRLPAAIGILAGKFPAEASAIHADRRGDILRGLHFVDNADALDDFIHSGNNHRQRERAEYNRIKVWEFPDCETKVKDRYIVVLDPQRGLSGSADYGVITVFDRYWRIFGGVTEVAAEWRGRLDKDVEVWVGAQIARWYNDALFVVEKNIYGSGAGESDAKEYVFDLIVPYYENLYTEDSPADRIMENMPVRYGFFTGNIKGALVSNYTGILREHGYRERNSDALDEAAVYETKKDGKFGAKAKKHDDRLMTRMIGLWIDSTMPFPVIVKENKTRVEKRDAAGSLAVI